ncbi:MAG: hypothetical protein JSW26_00080 [Desulfobacterales bacterium]|nr:MAG: hypothetical protein JSW26_00080 [Desulfobacterales bacterium]
MQTISADMLIAGADTVFTVNIPASILRPANGAGTEDEAGATAVTLRPLRLADLVRVQKAAKDNDHLASVVMVQQSLVEPKVSIDQVNKMHVGLVQFLLQEVNRISGISMSADELENTVQAPLARACFVLAREFGWTPEQCAGLTLGQVLVYLEMLGKKSEGIEDAI